MMYQSMTLEAPWSLQSSRFVVRHVRLRVQIQHGEPLVSTIKGRLPDDVEVVLEDDNDGDGEPAYLFTVNGLRETAYSFADFYTSLDCSSGEPIRLASRPRPGGGQYYPIQSSDIDMEGMGANLYILEGITLHPLAKNHSHRDRRFEINQDMHDFDGCWHEMITITMDSKQFHVPKKLAEARLPYVATRLCSKINESCPLEMNLHIPNATAEAFESMLGIMVGGEEYFEKWWWENDWDEALELLVVADFLGCSEFLEKLEALLIQEFQCDRRLSQACSMLERMESNFPLRPKLVQACLCSVSFQFLAELCRTCNASYLEKLLRQHTICDLKSLKEMAAEHVTTFAPLLDPCNKEDVYDDGGSSHSNPRQHTFDTMHFHLSQAQDRAEKAEAEVARLKEQLLSAQIPRVSNEGPSSSDVCYESSPELAHPANLGHFVRLLVDTMRRRSWQAILTLLTCPWSS